MLLLEEQMKENRFSTGSCLSIRTPEKRWEIFSKTGSCSDQAEYNGGKET